MMAACGDLPLIQAVCRRVLRKVRDHMGWETWPSDEIFGAPFGVFGP
jgi:hypothetical protein